MTRRIDHRIALGGLSGLAASWVMSRALGALAEVGTGEALKKEKQAQRKAGAPATIKLANRAKKLVGDDLGHDARRLGGKLVHYGYGGIWGALFAYGLTRIRRAPPLLAGLAFGAALWLLSDELLVPLAGLSLSPREYPMSVHAKGLASHLVYGVVLEGGVRALSRFA